MTIKQFIEAAIEGGWKLTNSYEESVEVKGDYIIYCEYSIFLDPLAWKAVGKVKVWKAGEFPYLDEFIGDRRVGFVAPYEGVDFVGEYWQFAMHLMIDALIKGRTLEEYIATL